MKKLLFTSFVIILLGCSGNDDDINNQRTCWTVLDAVTDLPIEFAYVSTHYRNSSNEDVCFALSYRTDANGVACYGTSGQNLCDAKVGADGYVEKEYPNGNIPSIIKLTPL